MYRLCVYTHPPVSSDTHPGDYFDRVEVKPRSRQVGAHGDRSHAGGSGKKLARF